MSWRAVLLLLLLSLAHAWVPRIASSSRGLVPPPPAVVNVPHDQGHQYPSSTHAARSLWDDDVVFLANSSISALQAKASAAAAAAGPTSVSYMRPWNAEGGGYGVPGGETDADADTGLSPSHVPLFFIRRPLLPLQTKGANIIEERYKKMIEKHSEIALVYNASDSRGVAAGGVLAEICQREAGLSANSTRIVLRGQRSFELTAVLRPPDKERKKYAIGEVKEHATAAGDVGGTAAAQVAQRVAEAFLRVLPLRREVVPVPLWREEHAQALWQIDGARDPEKTCWQVARLFALSSRQKQQLLQEPALVRRLEAVERLVLEVGSSFQRTLALRKEAEARQQQLDPAQLQFQYQGGGAWAAEAAAAALKGTVKVGFNGTATNASAGDMRTSRSQGSGFVLWTDAEQASPYPPTQAVLLTNAHAVDDRGRDDVDVTFSDGRTLRGKVLKRWEDTEGQHWDFAHDFALLHVPLREEGLRVEEEQQQPQQQSVMRQEGQREGVAAHALVLGDSESAKVGEWCLTAGYPSDVPALVTLGIVSGLSRPEGEGSAAGAGPAAEKVPDELLLDVGVSLIATDCTYNKGISGGPLVNAAGEVIGLNTFVRPGLSGIGFAVAINRVRSAVNAYACSPGGRAALGRTSEDGPLLP